MKRSTRSLSSLSALALLVGGTLGTGCDTPEPAPDAELVAVLPLSGNFFSFGQAHRNAIELAIGDLRDADLEAALGRDVGVRFIDSNQEPDAVAADLAALLAEKTSDDTVDLLGVISANQSAAEVSLPLAIEARLPHFNTASSSDDAEIFHDHGGDKPLDASYSFSARPTCNDEAIMTASFLAERFAGKKVLMVRGTAAHDKLHTSTLAERLATAHPGAVDLIQGPTNADNPEGAFLLTVDSSEDANFQGQLQALIDEHSPDVIYWHLEGDSKNQQLMIDLSRVEAGAGFAGSLVTCGMARQSVLLDPSLMAGTTSYLSGKIFFSMRAPVHSPSLTQFVSAYRAKYSDAPQLFGAGTYDAAVLLALGGVQRSVAAVDVRDAVFEVAAPAGEKHDLKSLSAALQALAAGVDIDYDGPSSSLDMDPESHVVPGDYYIEAIVEDGNGGFEFQEQASPARQTLKEGEAL